MNTESNSITLARTYGLQYKTGDPVETPIGQVGYVTGIEAFGVLVRIPIKGQVHACCLTPKATTDSLWVFDHAVIHKAASCVL